MIDPDFLNSLLPNKGPQQPPPRMPAPPPMPARDTTRPRKQSPRQDEGDYLKRQVGRMLQAGASDADVARFLQAEGYKIPNIQIAEPRSMGEPPTAATAGFGPTTGIGKGMGFAAIQGITFGFGDEAAGKIAELVGRDGDDVRDTFRREYKQFQSAHPIMAMAGEMAGGIAVPGIGAAKIAANLGGRALGTAGRVAAAGAEGMAGGALAGAGAADGGMSERTRGMLIGGAAGAVLAGGGTAAIKALSAGPVSGALTGASAGLSVGGIPGALTGAVAGAGAGRVIQQGQKATGAVTRAVATRLPNLDWSKEILRAGPAVGTAPRRARELLATALERDGLTPEDAIRKAREIAATGAPVSALDVGGPAVEELVRSAVALRSPEKQKLVEMLLDRQVDQGGRLVDRLFSTLRVGSKNAHDAADKIVAARAKASKPLYDEAYDLEFQVTPKIGEVLSHPRFSQAYDLGRSLANLEDMAKTGHGLPIPPLFRQAPGPQIGLSGFGSALPPQGAKMVMAETLPVRAMDYVKRGLDQIIEAKGTADAPMSHQEAKALRSLLNDALDEVGNQAPVYSQARATFKSHSDVYDALHLGKGGKLGDSPTTGPRFLRKPPELITRELSSLKTNAEREMYRLGALQDISDEVAEMTAKNPNAARELFGGRLRDTAAQQNYNRIAALFGKDTQAAKRFTDALRAETLLSEKTGAALGSSRHTPFEQQDADLPRAFMSRGGRGNQVVGFAVDAVVSHFRGRWGQELSDEISGLTLKGANGDLDGLIALLAALKYAKPVHRAGVAVAVGQQAGFLTSQ